MRIDFDILQSAGFHCDYNKETKSVDIYPLSGKDITKELGALTGLGRKDCWSVQEEVIKLQIYKIIQDSN